MIEQSRSPSFNLEGYIACTVKYTDGSRKTVLEHREVMEQYLGYTLTSNEHVHHIDGDRRNNMLRNLEVLSKQEHARRH